MNDPITEYFQSLRPDAFAQETSAVHEKRPKPGKVVATGAAAWHQWVDKSLATTRETVRLSREPLGANMSILQSPVLARYFQPEPDETSPMYVERLKREAKLMKATWFFNVLVAPGASHYDNEPTPSEIDPDDVEAIQQALQNGRLSLCLCWHAEFLEENGEHEHSRTGIIPIIGDELGAGNEGEIDDDLNVFAGVLSAE